ncbi:hypothetical protein ES288_D13G089500v1 [Gossypium darwinii]|uniref:Amino acid transporter transmembrane domain-containing protein n=1 Tax=Gossypium darwinii TaxID=34276 RepID=A0A5D1ZWM5_GOSDA|nr:hypothetical protein ES288_D13G089500v1 [Gossypium darwinii]
MDFTKAEKLESQNEVQQPQQPTKGTSFFRTCFNGLNALSGVGILSLPYALAQGGWLSLFLLFLVAVLCWYTGLLLRRCMDTHPLIKTYPDIVEFLILGDNLDKLFPNTAFKVAGMKIRGKVMLTSLIVLPTTWLKSLALLAYVSAVFPTLCSSMKDRSKFSKVLLVCFITSTINYGSMAVMGYLMFGEHLKSQVTLNLPIKKMTTKIAIYTTLINPLTKYAIITTPITTAIEETSLFCNSRSLSILIRTALVSSTVIVALTIPFFGYVMAFIGSFLSVTASMLLPCLCYLKLNKAARKMGLELIIIVAILVAGLFIGVVGTFTSIKQIVKHL